MRRLLLPGLVIAFVLAIAIVPSVAMGVTIPAAPYSSAEDCRACHQVGNNGPVVHTVDFDVAPVDKTRCNVCHYAINPSFSGMPYHPPHGVGSNCADCHGSWPTTGLSLPWKQTVQAGSFGWFSNAESVNLDGPTLHAIHSRRQWPADVTSRRLGCTNCHAPAACDACHGPVGHDAHPTQNGNPAPAAPFANVSPLPAGSTFSFTTISCAASDCHAGIGTERITEDDDPSVSAPGWTSYNYANSGYTFLGGTALQATVPGTELTVPFTGNQVSIWGITRTSAGAINVYIDGAFVAQKDLYEGGSHARDGVWMSGDVGPGDHTLRIVTAVSPTNGGTDVWFDRIVARDFVEPARTTPVCTTCHEEKAAEHGYDTADHVADETATVAPELGGKTCAECHAMDLQTAHAAVSIPNGTDPAITGCSICHSVLPGQTLTAEGTINPDHIPQSPSRWDQTCEACHNAANAVVAADKHQNMANHALSGAVLTANQKCFTCHPLGGPAVVDLPTMHANADTTVTIAGVPTHLSACDVCHENPSVPRPDGRLSNDCSVCHFTFETHPKDHTSSYNLNGCNDAGCHTAAETVDPSSGTSVTVSDLVTVHDEKATGGAFDCNNCHLSTDPRVSGAIAVGDTDCDACHTLGAGGGQDDPHYILHWSNPPLAEGTPLTPHYAYVTGSAPGGTYTKDCIGCHTSNLVDEHLGAQAANGSWTSPPRHDAAGVNLTCDTCHNGSLNVRLQIQAGNTACDACHVVHKQIDAQHLTNFKPSPETACTDCHQATLSAIHNGSLVATTGGGVELSGCDVCHGYTTNLDSADDTMGARVQAAIAAGDVNNYCSNCHLGYHQNVDHTATAPESVGPDGCAGCHKDALANGTIDVTKQHEDVSDPGACKVCHNNPNRAPALPSPLSSPECASCHAITSSTGAGHTGLPAKHQSPTITSSCTGTGCHVADLPAAHGPYMSKFPAFADSCALCHKNPTRIADITSKTAACDSCHDVGPAGHIGVHVATDTVTVGCEDCHAIPAGGDIASLHANATLGPCNTCHNNPPAGGDLTMSNGVRKPNAACAQSGCHPTKDPYDPNHYPADKHADSQAAAVDPSLGTACGACHEMDLRAEHIAKATSTMPDGTAITCLKCHTSAKFNGLPDSNPGIGRTWDATCEQCHTVKHDQMPAKHDFSTIRPECGGSGCHAVGDVGPLHVDARTIVGGETLTGCAVCHQSQTAAPPRDCLTCHEGASVGHTSEHVTTDVDAGCAGCHASGNLVGEHITSGLKGTNGQAIECGSCHDSNNPSVMDAIATGDTSCDACHPAVNGRDRHQNQWTNEFVSSNSAVHRVNSSLPGMRSSFVINGRTYTWSLPTSSWLRSPWTTSSVVTCDKCHTLSGTASGPHGASVAVNIDPAYTGNWKTARLSGSNSTIICSKCHQNYSSMNGVHREGDHDGAYCADCHTNLPHGWRMPRMLAYTTDPAPYRSNRLNALSLENHSASGNWDESDCAANCEDHEGSISNKWPSVAQTIATLNGHVMDSVNATGIAGAVVRLNSGQSTVTVKGGGYRFENLPAGIYTVSVTATGFVGESASVTIAQNDDYFADFNLFKQGTLGGTVTDSVTNEPLADVTVTVNGQSSSTDALGKFDFGGMPAGTYSVTYALSGYTGQAKTFAVADGAATDASVALAKIMYGAVTGIVTDAGTGDPVSGATVSLGAGLSATTAGGGTYSISNVLYGDYTMTVSAAGHDTVTEPVTVDGPSITNDVALPVQTSANIAQGRPATASNTGSGSSASYAFDGSAATYWNSGSVGSTARWLRVDLGASPAVYNKFVIDWNGNYYARNVQVQVSDDGTTWTTIASTTSGTGGAAQTFTLANGQDARYVRLYLSSYNTSSGYRVDEFQVWSGGTIPPPPPAPINAAKGKTFSASASGSGAAANAGDGSYSTYWGSGSVSYSNRTQWLKVDLGEETAINKVVVGWNGSSYYARSFSVQVSTDNTDWTTVYSTTSGSSSNRTVTFSTTTARYVRVYCTNNNSSSGYRIYELEAWTP